MVKWRRRLGGSYNTRGFGRVRVGMGDPLPPWEPAKPAPPPDPFAPVDPDTPFNPGGDPMQPPPPPVPRPVKPDVWQEDVAPPWTGDRDPANPYQIGMDGKVRVWNASEHDKWYDPHVWDDYVAFGPGVYDDRGLTDGQVVAAVAAEWIIEAVLLRGVGELVAPSVRALRVARAERSAARAARAVRGLGPRASRGAHIALREARSLLGYTHLA